MFINLLPKSIRGKITLITAVVTISIAAVTMFICISVFQSFLRKTEIQSAEYNMQVISNNVSDDMENILYFAQWCCSNSDISRYLDAFSGQTRMPSISSKDYALRATALNTYSRLKEEFYNTHSSDYINRVIISPSNRRNYLQISDVVSSNTSTAADTLYENPLFQELLQAEDYHWIGLIRDPLLPFSQQLVLPVARPIESPYNSNPIGWLYLTISDRLILDYLQVFPLDPDSSLYLTIGGHSYRYQDGAFTEAAMEWEILSDVSSHTLHDQSRAAYVRLADGQRRLMITYPLGQYGWTITQVLSEQAYQSQQQIYVLLIAAIVLFIILSGILLYVLLNRMINRPVGRLQDKITAIAGGDFTRDPSIEWQDEFGAIGKGINQMSENVVSLMDKKVEDEKQKKDLEYQILQSQINPHFLYNTLNSIKWMATIQGASGIGEMTTALARLLKNISKGTTARIPLKEELELVNDYFLIQQYRYGGSIALECQIADESLYRCLIHRFTLQPIVENALFHGIEPKGCAGKIAICARRETGADGRELAVISVTDNGVGMTEETIRQVLSGDAAPSADFFRHVGINNVNRRIQFDYGEEYGITITSEPGTYTTMRIVLPFLTA